MRAIETIIMPAEWASLMINDDHSLAVTDPEEYKRAIAKIRELNAEGYHIVSCSEESFIARYEGYITNCMEYYAIIGGES